MNRLFLLFFLFVSLQGSAQCYHEVQVPKYRAGQNLPIFNGVAQSNIELDTVLWYAPTTNPPEEWQHGRVMWVKSAKPNCLSSNPNDCWMWCLVEVENYVPLDTIMEEVVVDTSQTKYFEFVSFENLIPFDYVYKDVECVCESDMTKKFMKKVKRALRSYDYYYASLDHTFSDELKVVLMEFQKDYGLPLGYLDRETLEYLEVPWPYE